MNDNPKLTIGIDPGTHTGFAVLLGKRLVVCETFKIHKALDWIAYYNLNHPEIHVIVEDARRRSGKPEAAQGAGAIKRECSIWEDFLQDLKISFKMIAPRKNGTRFRDEIFKASYPYWKKRTSEHARSAANLLI